MEIYSIGFTQTTAEHFFGRLKTAGVGRLLDVRLNNSSQLAWSVPLGVVQWRSDEARPALRRCRWPGPREGRVGVSLGESL